MILSSKLCLYFTFTDLSWFGDLILWTTTGGDMFMFNRTNGEKTQLTNIRNAYCVAYDWLGKKIFWSEPKLGVVSQFLFE